MTDIEDLDAHIMDNEASEDDYVMAELTLAMILHDYINEIYSPQEVIKVLNDEDYVDLGWINDHKSEARRLDDSNCLNDFYQVYSNRSGSYVIMVDKFRRYYCIDMGD